MIIKFTEEAGKDLDDAVKWYEIECRGLGVRFASVIDETLSRIIRYPQFNTEVKAGIYRALVNKFPYSIFYSIEDGFIQIDAVAHHHRLPFYWDDADS